MSVLPQPLFFHGTNISRIANVDSIHDYIFMNTVEILLYQWSMTTSYAIHDYIFTKYELFREIRKNNVL